MDFKLELRLVIGNSPREGITMKKITVLYAMCAVALLAAAAFSQEEVFSNPNVEYTFTLPNEKWKMTVSPSATSPNVEYVYGDRVDGHLEVRKLTVAKNTILTDVIHGDEEQKLQFKPGFVAGREERFSGRFSGTIYNFEYVASGRSMSGRYYFLTHKRYDSLCAEICRSKGLAPLDPASNRLYRQDIFDQIVVQAKF